MRLNNHSTRQTPPLNPIRVRQASTHLALVVLVTLPLFLDSCFVEESDLAGQQCGTECTTIQGSIRQPDQIPLSGTTVTLYWESYSGFLGGIKRKKAITTSDAAGSFQLNFTLRDDELNNGYYYLDPKLNTQTHITTKNFETLSLYIPKKDTTVEVELFIPRKATVKLIPQQLNGMQAQDYLSWSTYYRYGVAGETGVVESFDPQNSSTRTVDVAAEVPLIFRIYQIKNGITTQQTDTVTLQRNQVLEYPITFN